MREEELKKRRIFIRGTDLPKIGRPEAVVRRDINNTEPEEDESFKFDDFFGFEEELSQMESARVQYEKMEKQKLLQEKLTANSFDASIKKEEELEVSSFITIELEEDEENSSETSGFITFEEAEEKKEKISFKQCAHLKDDGSQCKRQAPKKSDYCKVHRKE